MWWPRTRWKVDDLSAYFVLLFAVATNASVAMADNGAQRCDESNTSAVIWTTALCTTLLILIIVAIYFAYCKRREHDWSSLWWKNNPDKNIVLQTSSPSKARRQKIGGTDNPSFSADSNVDECSAVNGGTAPAPGSTKIVHVPSSTVADDGLMGIDLSIKEEDDGTRTYMCKHDDGSKDRLVALRLVFDSKDMKQRNFDRVSDLSRSLSELVREYGLHVELETKEVDANTSGTSAAVETHGGGNDTEKSSVKSNILSAVRGTAQRLWSQKELVFKSSGGNCNRAEDANKDQNCSAVDAESGPASASDVVDTHAAAAVTTTFQKSTCSVVTVVNETGQKSSADGSQYRTLEYGASPADMEAQSSPECSIQCGMVIGSLEPVRTVTSVTSAAPPSATIEKDAVTAASSDRYVAAQVPVTDCSEGTTAPVVVTVDDDSGKNHAKPNVNELSNKHAAANPPPPPPRKYYVSVVPPVVPAAVTTPRAAPTTAETTNTIQQTTPDHSTVTPVKSLPSENNEVPVAVPDDYYWCTTTAMAPPVLSTFGKRASVAEMADDEKNVAEGEEENIINRVANNREAEKTGTSNGGVAAAAVEQLHVHGGSNAVIGGVTTTTTTTTTSIEDASLPSFSSDEDDDDNSVFVEKTKFPCTADADKNVLDECNPTVDAPSGKIINTGDDKESVAKVTAVRPGRYNDTAEDCALTSPAGAAGKEPKSPTTKLPTLRLPSSPPATTANNTSTYFGSSSASSSSSSSTSSSSPSSPTNHGGNNNNSPIVSKIPVRRQSAGSGGGGTTVVSSPLNNGTGKKSIPLPLSRSGSRLAMWSSAN